MPEPADSPVLLLAVAVLLGPGVILASAFRLAGLWWWATAGVFSIATIGISGVVWSWLQLPFGWWSVAVITALVAAIVLALQRLRSSSWHAALAPALGSWSRELILPAMAVLASALVITFAAFGKVPSMESFSQTYDAVFHLNAVAYITDTGDASSFTLYRINHPGEDVEFYPSAWHSLVALTSQLSSASIPAATNAVWLATSWLVWIPGVALLAEMVTERPGLRRVTVPAAAIFASCFAAFPYLLLDWGTLYPTGLAYALLPTGLAVGVVAVATRWWPDRGSLHPGRLTPLAVAFAWVLASAFSHPRSLPSFVVLVAPLIIVGILPAVATAWRDPARRRRTATWLAGCVAVAGAAGAAAWAYVYRTYDVANRPISDRLNGGPAVANQGFIESVSQVIFHSPISSPGEFMLAPAIPLAVVVAIGAVVAVRSRPARWMVVSLVLVGVLYALAAGSNSDFSKVVTGLWYKDKYRLFAMIAVLAVPLAALAVGAGYDRVCRTRPRWAVPAAVGVVLAIAAASWLGTTLSGMQSQVGAVFAVGREKAGKLVDEEQLALIRKLPDLIPEGELVAGNPWNGSGLSWALGDREALFPHLAGEWTPDALAVAQRLHLAGSDPTVCEAVARLRLHYVLDDPEFLWGSPPEAHQYGGLSAAPKAGVLELVESVGSSALYRISACG